MELARKKKKGSMDEWETQVAQKGFSLVLMGILLVTLALMIVKIVAGQPWSDVYCIFFVSMGIHYLYNGEASQEVRDRAGNPVSAGCRAAVCRLYQ